MTSTPLRPDLNDLETRIDAAEEEGVPQEWMDLGLKHEVARDVLTRGRDLRGRVKVLGFTAWFYETSKDRLPTQDTWEWDETRSVTFNLICFWRVGAAQGALDGVQVEGHEPENEATNGIMKHPTVSSRRKHFKQRALLG